MSKGVRGGKKEAWKMGGRKEGRKGKNEGRKK
jgi:hypothetical protein